MKVATIPTGALAVNTYFVFLWEPDDGETSPVIIVDPGDDGPMIVEVLKKNKLRPAGIALTHHHFDHVLGLKALKEAFPAIHIGGHPTDQPNFGPKMAPWVVERLRLWGAGEYADAMSALPEPDVELPEGATLEKVLGADATQAEKDAARKWTTLHTPGHSAPSVCFYNQESQQLISGDTMFYGTWGRTDLPDGDDQAMVRSLKRLFTLPPDTVVFPGHETYGFTLAQNKGIL
jgi:glyoxylase-like metal-dependent hydrolase (beta-lactamase superfamily II)